MVKENIPTIIKSIYANNLNVFEYYNIYKKSSEIINKSKNAMWIKKLSTPNIINTTLNSSYKVNGICSTQEI